MNNNSKTNGQQVQGTGDVLEELPVPDLSQIETWLTRDLGAAIQVLTAIHNDAELRRQMSVWFQGRVINYKNRPKVDPAQTKIPGT